VGAVGAGPDRARVVDVAAAERDVTVLGLAAPRARAVVAVLLDDAGAVLPGTAAGTEVIVVSDVAAVMLLVLVGGPATANWPPRRNDGGPLSSSL
jgi:hypothetical protein